MDDQNRQEKINALMKLIICSEINAEIKHTDVYLDKIKKKPKLLVITFALLKTFEKAEKIMLTFFENTIVSKLNIPRSTLRTHLESIEKQTGLIFIEKELYTKDRNATRQKHRHSVKKRHPQRIFIKPNKEMEEYQDFFDKLEKEVDKRQIENENNSFVNESRTETE